jgi:UDP-glucose 4-epimerase
MRAVVTGGAGFIGSHLVDGVLGKQGTVLVIDDLSTGTLGNLEDAKKSEARFSFLRCDVCDQDAAAALQQFKPDVVFHLAAQINVRTSVAKPVYDAMKNVVGTVNMLEASRRAGAKHFIFSSTGGAIYGEQEQFPASESHPTIAESPYGIGKRAAEEYLEYYARSSDMVTTSLRYSNVYGPRQNSKGESGVIAIFVERLFAGEQCVINGDGEQTRDFIYVDDVVSANLLAAASPLERRFNIYNVGTGKETTVLEIIEYLRKACIADNDRTIKYEHGPALLGEQKRSVIDSTKLKNELGWEITVSIDEGIKKTVSSFRDKSV